ncbi:MAG TPA: hypothetical protein VHB21_17165 [Minicystis sp.]|nr:hypothetical protein [Minicystis sp.]
MIARRERFVALLAGIVALLAPAAAWACPICAGRSVSNPVGQAVVLTGFVFFPFGVVYSVVRYIRAGLRKTGELDDGSEPQDATRPDAGDDGALR